MRTGTGRQAGFVLMSDEIARSFEPFALTRPAGELRAGGALIRERWEVALGMPCLGFIDAAHLDEFAEFDAPGAVHGMIAAGTIIVNARCAPLLRAVAGSHADASGARAVDAWTCADQIAAVRLDAPVAAAELQRDGRAAGALFARLGDATRNTQPIDGWWLDAVWDLVRHLNTMLASDAVALMPADGVQAPDTLTVLGEHPVHVDADAALEPMVIVDATQGPVLIRRGAVVQAFTRLVGPCIIGEDVTVAGGRIASCSIGERSKVNGELNSVIFIGHSNKGHEGFVGHSVLGRWANLGAGTITSNLKNSYGTVTLRTSQGDRDTGMQFLGSLIGDHVKTGIGTRLTTGCILGAGANVFGSMMPPKLVPPFAWGEPHDGAWKRFALDRFLVVAHRVMARRQTELTGGMRAQLSAAYAATHGKASATAPAQASAT